MFIHHVFRLRAIALAAGGCLLLGCSGGSAKPQNSAPADAASVHKDSAVKRTTFMVPVADTREMQAVEFDMPRPLSMPVVKLSAGHQATCLVKVGDVFPDAELVDLSGANRKLSELRGKSLTVVVFWTSRLIFAREELDDLAQYVVLPYQSQDVRAVAINVRDLADAAQKAAPRSKSFPVLLDSDGALFSRVATAKLPRTYLLDAAGKIVWFDVEYGRTTRRELQQAIRYLLQPTK